jgi:hypothetical protein
MSLLLLSACVAPSSVDPAPLPPSPPSEPDVPLVPLECAVRTQSLQPSFFQDATTLPDGSVLASTADGARRRSPDGVWSSESVPFPGLQLAPAPSGEVWGRTNDGEVVRRQLDGTWTALPSPPAGTPTSWPAAYRGFGADEVAMAWVHQSGPDFDDTEIVEAHWDGQAWALTFRVLPWVDVRAAAYAPDGRLVFATPDRLEVLEADDTLSDVSVGVGLWPLLRILDDGTWIGVSESGLFAGALPGTASTADPLHVEPEPSDPWGPPGAFAGTPSDLMVAVHLGVDEGSALVHFDGSALEEVDVPDTLVRSITHVSDGWIAGGGRTGPWAAQVSEGGTSIELDEHGHFWMSYLAVDDITGEAIAVGAEGAWARWDGAAWAAEPPAGLRGVRGSNGINHRPSIAATDGRLGFMAVEGGWLELRVLEADGGLSSVPIDREMRVLCGADGTLFAATSFIEGGRWQTAILRNAGNGWDPIDTTGITGALEVTACLAEASDQLWLGFDDRDGGGALVRWDGVSFESSETPANVGWLGRRLDGTVWVSTGIEWEDSELFIWDGRTLVRDSLAPFGMERAVQLADGSIVGLGHPGGFAELVRVHVDGTTEVLENPQIVGVLAGTSESVWTTLGTEAWSLTCEAQ